MDIFLDLLFNVVGILVLIVALAAVVSTTTRQVKCVKLSVVKQTEKKQINIICCSNRAVYLDREDIDGMERHFSVRQEGNAELLTPEPGFPDWMTFKELSQDKNRFADLLDRNPPENCDLSLLIYQDSFAMAGRLEEIAAKRGYSFRRVFLEMREPLEFRKQKAYSG